MAEGINIYKLTSAWYAFKCEHKLSGNHTDLFFYCVDLNNQLAWKEVFGLPTRASAEVLNMSPNTFRKILNDLVLLNVIKLVKKAKNELLANQISMATAYQNLLKLRKGDYKAFVKAQQQQLNTSCAIDIHTYNNTLKQLDIVNNVNSELEKQVLELRAKNEALILEVEKKKAKPLKKSKKEFPPEIVDFTREMIAYLKPEYSEGMSENTFWSNCDTIDKLIRLDNETMENIRYVMNWISNDDFWSVTLQGINKLREKNKQGVMQMIALKARIKAEKSKPQPTNQGYQTAAEKTKASHDQLQRDMERRFAEKLSKM